MTITTDFDLGEEVFFLHDNQVRREKIISVEVFNNGLHQREEYQLAGLTGKYPFNKIFRTKQELLNSL